MQPFRARQITVSYPRGKTSEYTLDCLVPAIQEALPGWTVDVSSGSSSPSSDAAVDDDSDQQQQQLGAVQWCDYDLIHWDFLKLFPRDTLVNAYPIRKALIRKNYLVQTAERYGAKHGQPLSGWERLGMPRTFAFALGFADELEELWADELWELAQLMAAHPHKLWILKPALADKAQGIRIFRHVQQLANILISFERVDHPLEQPNHLLHQTCVPVSQMRHWIIQEYIQNPLLLHPARPETYSTDPTIDRSSFRKHHLRVYVLAVGALSVYVYEEMLSLFSSKPYTLTDLDDLGVHLTNTCLQEEGMQETGEHEVAVSMASHPEQIRRQIHHILATLFGFVAQNDPVNFQLLPNAFELFGVDFLVDEHLKVWLLEINAGPDFSQTGDTLKPIISRLFQSTLGVLKAEYPALLGDQSPAAAATENTSPATLPGFHQVLQLQTGLAFR